MRRATLVLVTLALVAAPLGAQQWSVRGEAGRMRSTLDPAAASSSLGIGLRYEQPSAGFDLSLGTPMGSLESYWAGVGGWRRLLVRFDRLVAGVDLSGSALSSRAGTERPGPRGPLPGLLVDPIRPDTELTGHALALQALPLIGWEGPRVQVHARAGLSQYSARFQDLERDRTVGLADVQLTLTPTSTLALAPVARVFKARDEELATYAGLSAVIAHPRGSLWGGAGHWMGPDADPAWELGASLDVHRRASLRATARRDTFDPLHLQPPQTAWSLGLSIRVGGPPRVRALPVPAAYADGRATIRLPLAASPAAPRVAGDFNGWKPAPMQRTRDGWSYTVAVTPGVYNYAFVDADGEWFVPENVPGRKDDGMGGHVAVLVVQ
jgi:hypothetical protein